MTAAPRPILLSNTLTRAKEELVTEVPGKVRLYVCGVTVYASSHIGHARSAVAFDTLVRFLTQRGYQVSFVKNFTDVDDKIIKRGLAEGLPAIAIADRYVEEFYRDMDALAILRPDHAPRVTEFMPEIIALIERLIARGHAYVVEKDVYYSVASKPDYGKLSRRHLDEQEEGARVEVDERKRHPFDFALWKEAKPGEPFWPSPWGEGRPGWHIECSAMGLALLGENFELHGGGSDLIFPHHENEIAQSEGATGLVPWVRTWLHNGMITVNDEKMSKSLDNFFTIAQVLARYHPESLRLFFHSAHYRSPLDYSEQAIKESEQKAERLYGALRALDAFLGDSVAPPARAADGGMTRAALYGARGFTDPLAGLDPAGLAGLDRALFSESHSLAERLDEAFADDCNAARALGHVFDYVRSINRWLDAGHDPASATARTLAGGARHRLHRIGDLLGIFTENAEAFFAGLRARRLAFAGIDEATVTQAIADRLAARAARDFARADRIRIELAQRGIELKDSPSGTTWEVVRGLDPTP